MSFQIMAYQVVLFWRSLKRLGYKTTIKISDLITATRTAFPTDITCRVTLCCKILASFNFQPHWHGHFRVGQTLGAHGNTNFSCTAAHSSIANMGVRRNFSRENWAGELRKLAKENIDLHSVLIKKSEANLNDKDVFPQVCIDVFCQATYFHAVLKEACVRVVWLSDSLGQVDHSLTLTMDFSNLWKYC